MRILLNPKQLSIKMLSKFMAIFTDGSKTAFRMAGDR